MLEAHDRFILGEGIDGRLYLVHTMEPRFVAEIFEPGERGAPGEVITLRGRDRVLGNFAWIGQPAGIDRAALAEDVEMFFEVLGRVE